MATMVMSCEGSLIVLLWRGPYSFTVLISQDIFWSQWGSKILNILTFLRSVWLLYSGGSIPIIPSSNALYMHLTALILYLLWQNKHLNFFKFWLPMHFFNILYCRNPPTKMAKPYSAKVNSLRGNERLQIHRCELEFHTEIFPEIIK